MKKLFTLFVKYWHRLFSKFMKAERLLLIIFALLTLQSASSKTIGGYYPNWAVYARKVMLYDIPVSKVNQVTYAFLYPFVIDGTKDLGDEVPYNTDKKAVILACKTFTDDSGKTKTTGVASVDFYADIEHQFKDLNHYGTLNWLPGDTKSQEINNWFALGDNAKTGVLGQFIMLQNKGVEIHASLGGWTLSNYFPIIADDIKNRDAFATAVADLITKYKFNGIDLDWEFPVSGGIDGQSHSKEDPMNMVMLCKAIKKALPSSAKLSIATAQDPTTIANMYIFPGNKSNWSSKNYKGYDGTDLTQWCDKFNTMTYDYGGAWLSKSSNQAPLYNSNDANDPNQGISVDGLITKLTGDLKIPASFIAMGIPFYGRGWGKVSSGVNGDGLYQTSTQNAYLQGSWGEQDAAFDYRDLKDGTTSHVHKYIANGVGTGNNGFVEYWNDVCKVPYLYNKTTGDFISYDNPRSVAEKSDYAESKRLAGVFSYDLTMDDANHSMLTAMIDGAIAPVVSYPSSDLILTKGRVISQFIPSNTAGEVKKYVVTPSLPTGLSLDSITGIISGKPTGTIVKTAYTITATNSVGKSVFNISITVKEPKSVVGGYYTNWSVYARNVMIADLPSTMNQMTQAFMFPFVVDGTLIAGDNVLFRGTDKYAVVLTAKTFVNDAGVIRTTGIASTDFYADIEYLFPVQGKNYLGSPTQVKDGTNADKLNDWLGKPDNNKPGVLGQLIQAKAKGTEIVASIGGWTLAQHFPEIANDIKTRSAFANAVADFATKFKFGGIDLDWEFPVKGGTDGTEMIGTKAIPAQPHKAEDPMNMVMLCKAIKGSLPTGVTLSICTNQNPSTIGDLYIFPGNKSKWSGNSYKGYDGSDLTSWCDLFYTMTYDYGGGWLKTTSHSAPLYDSKNSNDPDKDMSVSSLISTLIDKLQVPAQNIIMGVPFYGRGWNNVASGTAGDGLFQSSTQTGAIKGSWDDVPGENSAAFDYGDLKDGKATNVHQYVLYGPGTGNNGFVEYWDNVCKVPYLYNKESGVFITYDNPRSIAEKVKFANTKGLGGVFTWECSQDDKKYNLINALATGKDQIPSIDYDTPPTFTMGTAIASLISRNTGGHVAKYAVSPALPSGLVLDSISGTIFGTPKVAAVKKVYTITAINESGSVSDTLSITVLNIAPRINYPNSLTGVINTAITALSPENSGGAVVSYAVNPALPSGLLLNATTGVISGTPTAITPTTKYIITATNTMGGGRDTILIKITDVAPKINYPSSLTGSKGIAISPVIPANTGGAVVSYTISPALPSGLSLNSTTGTISGTPTTIMAKSYYVVEASNTGGIARDTISITITESAPMVNYPPSLVVAKGIPIASVTPVNTGGAVVSYAISPALPSGLSFNNTTGAISGTPSVVVAKSQYIISATNAMGIARDTIFITVNGSAIKKLNYTKYKVKVPIGAYVEIYSQAGLLSSKNVSTVTPALPAGLFLRSYDAAIVGSANKISPKQDYIVMSTYQGDIWQDTISIEVTDIAPNISYGSAGKNCTIGVAMNPWIPNSYGGGVLSYSTIKPLPDGLKIDPSTGTISGTPTQLATTGTNQIVVVAANSWGAISYPLLINVFDAPPKVIYKDLICTKGVAATSEAPVSTGGKVTRYSAIFPLPDGLTIDASTGIVSGTFSSTVTSMIGQKSAYAISAENSGGAYTAWIYITTIDVAPNISYSSSSVSFTAGMAISPIVPINSGGNFCQYSISPSLPAGLTLNPSTGVISGTSTGPSEQKSYTISARNSGGTSTAVISITVVDYQAPRISYTPMSFVKSNFASIAPINTGATINVIYSVSPSLPTGLTLNTSTGVISGTPTDLSDKKNYTITASNSVGKSTTLVSIAVVDRAPDISYSVTNLVITPGSQYILKPTNTGGRVVSYSVSPALPAGLSINSSTGVISGISTSLFSAKVYCIITATNTGGTSSFAITFTKNGVNKVQSIGNIVDGEVDKVAKTVVYVNAFKQIVVRLSGSNLENAGVEIYDITGRKVISKSITDFTSQYDVPVSGVYIVCVTNAGEAVTKKVAVSLH